MLLQVNERYQTCCFLFSVTSCLPSPAVSPFTCLLRATGKAIGCRSWPNATATTKCCFSPRLVYRPHLAACWMIASVAQPIPCPHTGTGGSPRYTLRNCTKTPTLSPRRAPTVFTLCSRFTGHLRFQSESVELWITCNSTVWNRCFKIECLGACNHCLNLPFSQELPLMPFCCICLHPLTHTYCISHC